MRIKLLTFDLDDTLWDARPVLQRAEHKLAEWLIRHFPRVAPYYDSQRLKEIRSRLLSAQPQLAHQISQLRIEALREVLRNAGYDASDAEQGAHEGFEVFISHRHDVALYDEVPEILSQLRQRYRMAVLTNGNADIFRLELGGYFEFALSAETLRASKPSPDHFIAAMQRAQVRAGEVIHVGDHLEHDIAAASRLGIATIWANLSRQQRSMGIHADEEIRHFCELPAAIAAIEQRQSGAS